MAAAAPDVKRHGHPRSHGRHVGEPGREGHQYRPQLALDRPGGLESRDGLRQLRVPGLTYTRGSPLSVPAGKGFAGYGSIGDLVNCQGTITASNGSITLGNGLSLSGSGNVNLGNGALTVNDAVSASAAAR